MTATETVHINGNGHKAHHFQETGPVDLHLTVSDPDLCADLRAHGRAGALRVCPIGSENRGNRSQAGAGPD